MAEKVCNCALLNPSWGASEIAKSLNIDVQPIYNVLSVWRKEGLLPKAGDEPKHKPSDPQREPAGGASGKTSTRIQQAVDLWNAGDDYDEVATKLGITEDGARMMIRGAGLQGTKVRIEGADPVSPPAASEPLKAADDDVDEKDDEEPKSPRRLTVDEKAPKIAGETPQTRKVKPVKEAKRKYARKPQPDTFVSDGKANAILDEEEKALIVNLLRDRVLVLALISEENPAVLPELHVCARAVKKMQPSAAIGGGGA